MHNNSSAPPQYNSQSVLERYDITGIFAQKLNQLQGFKMVCICDDSTSMKDVLNKGQTKWDELKQSIDIVLEIGTAYNVDCDVLFLNRPGFRNVKHINQLNEQFSLPPQDGSPTSNENTKDPIREFKHALKYRQPINRIFVTIIACTDDDYALKYLNDWDNKIKNLDVVDDYESEKKEIYAAGKIKTSFTYGDYIAKILLGSFIKEIDELDERNSDCNLL